MPPRTPRKAPAPAAPLSREELIAVAREALHALPGLRPADLKKKLPKPLQPQHTGVLEALRDLAAGGEVFRHVTGKAERFFEADPAATLDRAVTEILGRAGPLDEAAIKKVVTAAAPGHGDLVKEWLRGALGRRVIFEHAPAPKSRAKRFGSTPDLGRLLGKTFVELRKALAAIDEAGVPRERVIDAIRAELGLAGAPSPATPSPASAPSPSTLPSATLPPATPSSATISPAPVAAAQPDRDVVLAALQKLASERRPGTLLHVRDLRARTPLDKERFDAAALALSREGLAVLHHHDHPAALAEEDRRALVADGRGTHYIGIAPRSPE